MECSFCHSPAAHPSTGCQYSPRVIACRECTVAFWRWFREQQHSRGRAGHVRSGGVMADFYEAAGRRVQSSAATE